MALVTFINKVEITPNALKAAFQRMTFPVPSVPDWLTKDEIEQKITDLEGSFSLATGGLNDTRDQIAEYRKALVRLDELTIH